MTRIFTLAICWTLVGCEAGDADLLDAEVADAVDAADPADVADLDADVTDPADVADLDGGPCGPLDQFLGPPCTEGRTCAPGPFCWGGEEHFCPPGFSTVADDTCDDGLYVGDEVEPRDPDPRCPPAPDQACPGLLNLVCVYPCGEGFRAQGCDGERFVDWWTSRGCE